MSPSEIEPAATQRQVHKPGIWSSGVVLARPRISPHLRQMSLLERVAEVLRYAAFRAEFWMSPSGILREWLRRLLSCTLILIVSVVVLGPLVASLLGMLVDCSQKLAEFSRNLAVIPAWAATALLALFGVAVAKRLLFGR